MRFTYLLVTTAVLAAHAWKRNDNASQPNDVAILNYVLSLANLQNAFYNQSLAQFDENAFNQSGFGPNVRDYFVQISQNKQAQVNLIAQTLGREATPYCSYDFHVNNVTNFTETSQVIENIGTSAYIGSIAQLQNSTYQTWAASILANNARTVAWVSTINGVAPWDGPFDPPLSPQEVTTITGAYIITCPTNSTDVFKPGTNLTVSQSGPGTTGAFSFAGQNSTPGPLYATFFQGLDKIFVPLNNDTATIPTNLTGVAFVEVTNSTDPNISQSVAGPAFINLSIPQNGTTNATSPVPVPVPSPPSSSATISESQTSAATTASQPSVTSEQSTVTETSTTNGQASATSSPGEQSTTSTTSEQSTVTVIQTATPSV